ncbi:hypothetical protein JOC85_001890 [Bacillus mesophilus]|uniref:YhfM-like domain-containing protein n=1 Tax=Bacillus mesophilus TaxID=1808955 RepID=A0A6M0Q538_9BACI|nr:hypothetical protein [Bacillus mesophilus]MBM7661118.1 hypothetical protein [Bacillus mesophilus]NEY71353.1 hypothetical protein [Bacillus mesophilus]
MSKVLFLISISLLGCQQTSKSLEQVTIATIVNSSGTLVVEDKETIELIEDAVNSAEKQPGIVNMADPEFKIEIGESTYYLWIDEKFGTIMNTEDTHTIYSLSVSSVSKINELISYHYINIGEIAWNFLKEKGWSESAHEELKSATVTKVLVTKEYELLEQNYEGKEVFSVSFEDKENSVVSTSIILVDVATNKVIGYLPGE